MFSGLAEEIENCEKDKQLIVIHCYTSHGPKYFANYPAEFEIFTPACKSIEMSSINKQELVNAYDNTILYTDYLVYAQSSCPCRKDVPHTLPRSPTLRSPSVSVWAVSVPPPRVQPVL